MSQAPARIGLIVLRVVMIDGNRIALHGHKLDEHNRFIPGT